MPRRKRKSSTPSIFDVCLECGGEASIYQQTIYPDKEEPYCNACYRKLTDREEHGHDGKPHENTHKSAARVNGGC